MEFDMTLAAGLVLTAGLVAMAALLGHVGAVDAAVAATRVDLCHAHAGHGLPVRRRGAGGCHAACARHDRGGGAGIGLGAGLSRLEPLFPGLTLRMEGLEREGRFVLCSREDVEPPLVLRAENLGGLTRLTLMDTDTEQRHPGRDGAADVALDEELWPCARPWPWRRCRSGGQAAMARSSGRTGPI